MNVTIKTPIDFVIFLLSIILLFYAIFFLFTIQASSNKLTIFICWVYIILWTVEVLSNLTNTV